MDSRAYLLALEQFGIKFGLANMRALTAALGHPERTFRSVLVAGTNGKGSVAAMTATALGASGLCVGRYTSPHLVRLEERFTIGGADVPASELTSAADRVRDAIDTLLTTGGLDAPPTFFEATTACAFELFRRARVDVGVLEVGLGGRLDATNVVEPIAAAVTSIGFDHEQYLGNTLASIAAEKAGVIRPDIPVVIGPMDDEARQVLVGACRAAGARLIDASGVVHAVRPAEAGRLALHAATPVRTYGWLPIGLRGAHQVRNALVAVRLLEALEPALPVTADAIAAGLRDVRWPGRLQILEAGDDRRLLLDAAHNPAGAAALAEYLRDSATGPIPLVFGAMRDKNAAGMLAPLAPFASPLIVTQAATPRASPASELGALARATLGGGRIEIEPDPQKALALAWTHGRTACAAGSIFLIGDLIAALGPSWRER